MTTSYAYDTLNRMTGITGPVTASYSYNGDGRRVSKTVNSSTTTYTWDQLGLGVVLGDGNEYVWGLGLIGQITGSSVETYAHADGLGSTRVLTDGAAASVGTQAYDAFGGTRTQSGTQLPFTYTGEQVDAESGLVYLRARYMDPAQGRFSSRDLVPGWVSIPASLQRYSYAWNSPVNRVDPTGLCSWTHPWQCADEIDDGAGWVWDYATDSPTGLLQIADLIPIAEECGLAALATSGTLAPIIPICGGVEEVIGTLAAIATQTQIARSDCSSIRKLKATIVNFASLAVETEYILAQESLEILLFTYGNLLLQCNVTPSGNEDIRSGNGGSCK